MCQALCWPKGIREEEAKKANSGTRSIENF